MKKILVALILGVLLPQVAGAQRPARIATDTLPCGVRQPNYWYSDWFDTTDWYLYGSALDHPYPPEWSGGLDTIFWWRWDPNRYTFERASGTNGSDSWTFEQYADHPIRIKGLWAMVSQYVGGRPEEPYFNSGFAIHDSVRLPEYLYLYVRDSSKTLPIHDTSSFLVRIATVRWDTAQPKMMCIQKTIDPAFADAKAYVHVYEALFDTVYTLEGEFWIGGSGNSNTLSYTPTPEAPMGHAHFPTVYTPFGANPDHRRDGNPHAHVAKPEGNRHDGPWHSYRFNPRYSPFGVVTDGQRYVEVASGDTAQGLGLYTAFYPDSSYQSITTVPNRGYRFSHWNDSVTEDPRTVFVTCDTSFTAYFAPLPLYVLEARSNDEELGHVTGGDSYYEGEEATLQAVPNTRIRFVRWNDGVTDNPRTVVVTQDTVFTAQFEPIPQYNVTVESNDHELGYVTHVGGNGTYYEGDEAVIKAVAHPGNHFERWNDSVTANPRSIVVVQDTLFTAYFVSGPLGVRESDEAGVAFRLVPNPASDEVRCETEGEGFGGGVLTVADAAGREVLRRELAAGTRTLTLDLSDLPAGTYFVTLVTRDGTGTKRLVVEGN